MFYISGFSSLPQPKLTISEKKKAKRNTDVDTDVDKNTTQSPNKYFNEKTKETATKGTRFIDNGKMPVCGKLDA
ncbi:hypothetical protein AX774_g4778 [Zancudomyces culisetae]|uniref:Uncharacterized protein n=1 Tax=Zancudomyces culisetae TaxID=1213189 RepID=A0A1R1PEW8_ZANCU|nr:hypothetical protein AX774_g7038 [Zancudomyces culisetae]OMH81756.1 hypothetical protein AX774_g4778 [Zancudomyces culisetae]|eukprot:OMH79540.1 hypothetical protein AX774_g7038 [Zancudomyces culisetae]